MSAHLASWLRRRELYLQAEAQIARVVRESRAEVGPHPNGPIPAGGDPWQLRGIPVVGVRGVGGAVPGSKPGTSAPFR